MTKVKDFQISVKVYSHCISLFDGKLCIKAYSQFHKVALTTTRLFRERMSKRLAVVLVGNKFKTELSPISHVKVTKPIPKEVQISFTTSLRFPKVRAISNGSGWIQGLGLFDWSSFSSHEYTNSCVKSDLRLNVHHYRRIKVLSMSQCIFLKCIDGKLSDHFENISSKFCKCFNWIILTSYIS